MFHRGWLEGGRRRGSKRWFTGTAASFSVSRISLVGFVGLVCVLSLHLVMDFVSVGLVPLIKEIIDGKKKILNLVF